MATQPLQMPIAIYGDGKFIFPNYYLKCPKCGLTVETPSGLAIVYQIWVADRWEVFKKESKFSPPKKGWVHYNCKLGGNVECEVVTDS